MIVSVCFSVCFIALWFGICFVKKTNRQENGVAWLIISMVMLMCYQTFLGGIFNLIGVKIGIISFLIADSASAIVLWVYIKKTGEIQQLTWRIFDFTVMMVLGILTLCAAKNQFGFHLYVNYLTADPGTHFRMALKVIDTGKVETMYYAQLNNALFLEVFKPVFGSLKLYKAFVLSDLCMYFLSGASFYALVAKLTNSKYQKAISLFITVAYMLGYPRNNLGFGFVYLGMGVTIIVVLIFLMNLYIETAEKKVLTMISLGCLGIALCYVIFAPVLYISVACEIIYIIWKKRELSIKNRCLKIIYLNLYVFVVPCLFALYYNLATVSDGGVGNLSAEGFIYRNLYSDYLWVLPIAILGIIYIISIKRNDIVYFILFLQLIFMAIVYVMSFLGKVSTYYYFKNNFVCIMLLCYLGIWGFYQFENNLRRVAIVYISCLLGLAVICFSGIESKLHNISDLLNPNIVSDDIFNIYIYNMIDIPERRSAATEEIQLYEEYASLETDGNPLIFNGELENYNWFRDIIQPSGWLDGDCWPIFLANEVEVLANSAQLPKSYIEDKFTGEHGSYLSQKIDESEGFPIIILNENCSLGEWKELPYADKVIDVKYENAAGCIGVIKF